MYSEKVMVTEPFIALQKSLGKNVGFASLKPTKTR
jgi:hypothetical protein